MNLFLRIRHYNIECVIYCIGIALYTIYSVVNVSFFAEFEALKVSINAYTRVVVVLFPLLMGTSFVLERRDRGLTIREIVLVVAAYVLQRWFSLNNGFNLSSLFWCVLAFPQRLSVRDVLRVIVAAGLVTSVAIIASALVGEIQDNIRYEHGTLRYGLGFWAGVFLSYVLTGLLMCYMFIRLGSWRFIDYSICLSCALVIFAVGNGRGSFFATIGLLFGVLIWRCPLLRGRLRSALGHLVKGIAILCYPVLTALSLIGACFLGNPSIYTSNGVVGGGFGRFIGERAQFWYFNYQETGVTLRGARDARSYPLDNAFLWLALLCGLVVLVVVCVLYAYAAIHMDAEDDYYRLLFIVVLAVFSFTCMFSYSLVINPTWLFLGESLSHSKRLTRHFDLE